MFLSNNYSYMLCFFRKPSPLDSAGPVGKIFYQPDKDDDFDEEDPDDDLDIWIIVNLYCFSCIM